MNSAEIHSTDVLVETSDARLPGDLSRPASPTGIVLFAHGSGSSRFSPRNRHVADRLNDAGLATLLFDLLTPDEHERDQRTAEFRFDIDLLTRRLDGALGWVLSEAELTGWRIGLFGASTGAAAALRVAAERGATITAVVSRGGRPDLAGDALGRVTAPTCLIVGGLDRTVLELNREAAALLRCEHRIDIVPGATHLFEEPGKLDDVAGLAAAWFRQWLEP